MPAIFISHASRDDAIASQLEQWLVAQGFDDLFVDHSDIRGGDKWTEALRRAKSSCRVVLCLVTPNWLASDECFGEFTAAWYAGKRIIPLLALGNDPLDLLQQKHLSRVLGEDQGFDLSKVLTNDDLDLDAAPEIFDPLKAGLRAGGALARVGLDPEAFEIDRDSCPAPFPGLQAFGDTDADAAIFYGRSPEIVRCLEALREMRANGTRQPFAILGASGSGKSSLLKAGVLPRLRRERGWIVVRTFRPGADPLFNFADAIARTLDEHGQPSAPGSIRDRLRSGWEQIDKQQGFATERGLTALRETLTEELLAPLRRLADRPAATVLLPLDQAEELARTEDERADILCDFLRAALLSSPQPIDDEASPVDAMVVLTARSDSFPELQKARRFDGLDARCEDIRSVSMHRLAEAIERPAARYGVQMAPDLVDAMIDDAPTTDALPLFAFALERLWQQFHQEGHIHKTHYETVGGLDGLIEDAAERALRDIRPGEDRPIDPKISSRRDQRAARTFVPALAQVNEKGEPIRRVAEKERFDDEAQEILKPFEQWRLLIPRQLPNNAGSTVEIAHEVIFRVWSRFRHWLEPEKARLEALRGLETAARVWEQHKRSGAYLDHRGRRLKAAQDLLDHEDFKDEIDPNEQAYLKAASRAQRVRWVAGSGAGLAVLAIVLGVSAGSIWAIENDATLDVSFRVAAINLGLTQFAGPEMVEVPIDPEGFLMGSPVGEEDRYDDEGPQHRVTIAEPFAMGVYEVTFDDWDVCYFDGGCNEYRPSDEGWGRGDRPVINVSWDDAQAYVEWLSDLTGEVYRLPSEAEWEYAARAGTTTAYALPAPDGSDDISGKGLANCDGCGSEWDGNWQTAPVGSFEANAFGLHDMHGTVWEWCADIWHDSYVGAPTDDSAWLEGGDQGRQVLRGGSWGSGPRDLRSAIRVGNFADNRGNGFGFRVARTLR